MVVSQKEKNPCETLTKINFLIQQQHYRPKAVDDSLSATVFDAFLKTLDDDNRLFTEIEINFLKKMVGYNYIWTRLPSFHSNKGHLQRQMVSIEH
jgi:hypothetical protein